MDVFCSDYVYSAAFLYKEDDVQLCTQSFSHFRQKTNVPFKNGAGVFKGSGFTIPLKTLAKEAKN